MFGLGLRRWESFYHVLLVRSWKDWTQFGNSWITLNVLLALVSKPLFYVSLSKSLYLEEIFRFVRLEHLPYRGNGKYLIELWNRWKSYSIFKCCITNKVLIKARYARNLVEWRFHQSCQCSIAYIIVYDGIQRKTSKLRPK